ncbi:peptidylprolyl isomerase [Phocicoccus pinnipedialis]|uniref:peptidylprolyl isomerase n=1 Tax=Phocicoccus pinnipedialis TaxID=110845 RepID=A0A6V7RLI0_9BACL|nr:peptidylprolyl isomerase [Jeotgalicoccus pinnipedialis]MBP1939597.1 foldase protein PrsA [Jeotgalicoccus pinnipedialis]CAD2079057.1 Foldase protein PrsA precursor [Jeotgalicoccus pinnipedialis]
MKKLLMSASLSSLLVLAACGTDNSDDKKESSSDKEIKYDNVLAESKAGDVTVDDILNSIGTTEVANQTFELTLNKVLEDKYKDEINVDEISKQVDKEIENYGGEQQFSQILAQTQPGMTIEKYKANKIANALHNRYFAEKFEITDDAALKDAVKAQHILVKVGAEQGGMKDEDAKKKIDEVIKKAKDGEDFGELAKEYSDDGSADQGGDLGLVTKGQMVPEFEKALYELEPGEISDVVKTQFGYHVIKRQDTKKEDLSDEEISSARQTMVQQKLQENQNKVVEFYKDLLDEYEVKFTNEDIKKQVDQLINQEAPEEKK